MPDNPEITLAVHEDRIARLEAEHNRMREKIHEHGNRLAILSEVKENFDRLDRHVREMGRDVSGALSKIDITLTDIKTKLAGYDGQAQGETARRSAIMSGVGLVFSVIVALIAVYVFLENHLVSPS